MNRPKRFDAGGPPPRRMTDEDDDSRDNAGSGDDCEFCAICVGEGAVPTFYEDGRVVAFPDAEPATRGHALVIPRRHVPDLAELDEATGGHLFAVGMRVAEALRDVEGVDAEGINLLLADGERAGQVVPHVHLHVIPRHRGDGVDMSDPRLSTDLGDLAALVDALERRL